MRTRYGAVGVFGVSMGLLSLCAVHAEDLFISEYVEGSGFNQAIEVYNPTDSYVDLDASSINIKVFYDGSDTPEAVFFLAGLLEPGDVFVVANFLADSALTELADWTPLGFTFDGNDAVVLARDNETLDALGEVGFDPGEEWGTGDVTTRDHTLRRLPAVCEGDVNPVDPFDPTLEWTGFPIDTFDGLGGHTSACGPSAVESQTWGRIKALHR